MGAAIGFVTLTGPTGAQSLGLTRPGAPPQPPRAGGFSPSHGR
jgi:hypothetical protein